VVWPKPTFGENEPGTAEVREERTYNMSKRCPSLQLA
jgi:hypothetical protein